MSQVTDNPDGQPSAQSPGVPPVQPPGQSHEHLLDSACYALAVRSAARSVTNFYDQTLKPTGLRITQVGILYAVSIRQPAALSLLAADLAMDRTTLTRNLGPLQREELVAIHDDPADGRSRVVSLTAAGTRRLEQALPLWDQAQAGVEARFGAARAAGLRSELHTLADTQLTPTTSDATEHHA